VLLDGGSIGSSGMGGGIDGGIADDCGRRTVDAHRTAMLDAALADIVATVPSSSSSASASASSFSSLAPSSSTSPASSSASPASSLFASMPHAIVALSALHTGLVDVLQRATTRTMTEVRVVLCILESMAICPVRIGLALAYFFSSHPIGCHILALRGVILFAFFQPGARDLFVCLEFA
jgi:hypothetical protein